jgi:hypothetical protein
MLNDEIGAFCERFQRLLEKHLLPMAKNTNDVEAEVHYMKTQGRVYEAWGNVALRMRNLTAM